VVLTRGGIRDSLVEAARRPRIGDCRVQRRPKSALRLVDRAPACVNKTNVVRLLKEDP
jgi:hypothetical protein